MDDIDMEVPLIRWNIVETEKIKVCCWGTQDAGRW